MEQTVHQIWEITPRKSSNYNFEKNPTLFLTQTGEQNIKERGKDHRSIKKT